MINVTGKISAVLGALYLFFCLLNPISLYGQNVVDVLSSYDQVSTFVDIIQESGVSEKLSSNGPYTIFAPSNSALDDMQGTLNRSSSSSLREFVMNHVMTGMATKRQIMVMSSAPTLGGITLEIQVQNNDVSINQVSIVRYNIRADNGVVHVIDGTLQ
ncbi:MAG: fasciclin domain-containing protein [Balneolaceae bacterium]|nr:fasciclin domain-containing protein [Balneolaceae bacterium]